MSPSLLATAFADLHSRVALQTGRYLKLVHMEVKQKKKGKDFQKCGSLQPLLLDVELDFGV